MVRNFSTGGGHGPEDTLVEGDSKMSWRIVAEAFVLVTLWGIRDRVFGRRKAQRNRFPASEAG